MKITIEATNKQSIENGYHKVSIETMFDDLTLEEVLEQLIKPALNGFGYHSDFTEKIIIYEQE